MHCSSIHNDQEMKGKRIIGCKREEKDIVRCAGKAGNPFQTTQGNRLSCRDQEWRRGSEEAVPGPPVFPCSHACSKYALLGKTTGPRSISLFSFSASDSLSFHLLGIVNAAAVHVCESQDALPLATRMES